MNEVEGLTFDGILKLSESKFGTKYTMKIMDVLYLPPLEISWYLWKFRR